MTVTLRRGLFRRQIQRERGIAGQWSVMMEKGSAEGGFGYVAIGNATARRLPLRQAQCECK